VSAEFPPPSPASKRASAGQPSPREAKEKAVRGRIRREESPVKVLTQ
jgi:hypothetical protein